MSLETIRKSILAEAEAEANSILKGGGEEAGRIIGDAKEKAKAIIKKAEESAEEEERRLERESEAGLETETHSILVEAKNSAIEKSLNEARKKIEGTINKEHLEELLKVGMKQFSQTVYGGELVLRISKKNAGMAKDLDSKVDVEYGDVDGIQLYSSDKKVGVSISGEALVEKHLDLIRKEIASALFSEREPATKPAIHKENVKKKEKKVEKKRGKPKKEEKKVKRKRK